MRSRSRNEIAQTFHLTYGAKERDRKVHFHIIQNECVCVRSLTAHGTHRESQAVPNSAKYFISLSISSVCARVRYSRKMNAPREYHRTVRCCFCCLCRRCFFFVLRSSLIKKTTTEKRKRNEQNWLKCFARRPARTRNKTKKQKTAAAAAAATSNENVAHTKSCTVCVCA